MTLNANKIADMDKITGLTPDKISEMDKIVQSGATNDTQEIDNLNNEPVSINPVDSLKFALGISKDVLADKITPDEAVKKGATRSLKQRERWENEHPYISDLQKAYQPFYRGTLPELELKSKYGLNPPIEEKIKADIDIFGQNAVAPINMIAMGLTSGANTFLQGLGMVGLQGGLYGGTESLADKGLTKDLVGDTTGAIGRDTAFYMIPKGLRVATKPITHVIGKTIENSTRVPMSYIKQAIKPYSQALDIPVDAARHRLSEITSAIQRNYEEILKNAGQNVGRVSKKLPKDKGIPVNELRKSINNIFDSYGISGNKAANVAYNQAGKEYGEINDLINRISKERLEQDKLNYIKQIDNFKSGKLKPDTLIDILSETPDIWQKHGVPKGKITISQQVYSKAGNLPNKFEKNHNIDSQILENLPELLQEPKYILKSSTVKGRYVGILDAKDNSGQPIAVILQPAKGRLKVNIIPSAYGRSNFNAFINRQKQAGNILYKKGASPRTTRATIAQASGNTPNNSIAYPNEYFNMNASELFDLKQNITNKINWDKTDRKLQNEILERVYGDYSNKLASLSPELRAANETYANIAGYRDKEGLKRILKSFEDNKIDTASSALRNYDSTITKGNTEKNVRELEELFINNGYEPFVNKLDDINAANLLQERLTTGDSSIQGFIRDAGLIPALKGAREFNRGVNKVKAKIPDKLKKLKINPDLIRPFVVPSIETFFN